MNIENSSAVEAVELTAGMDNLDLNTKRVKPNLRLIDTTKAKKKGKIVHREIGLVERIFKRTLDIIGGIVGVILLIPITIGVMIANKIAHDEGPVFFIQKRIGKNGKPFKMIKFRSMIVGADEALYKYLAENPEAREEYRINKKLKNDPRITKVGAFIRKTSLDEFPQFINILKGDMSLVGPRPYLPRERKDMGIYYKYIVARKPGLTGFWQVNGRNDVTFADRLYLDMKYYDKSSIWLDIKLLLKTVHKVIRKEGVA